MIMVIFPRASNLAKATIMKGGVSLSVVSYWVYEAEAGNQGRVITKSGGDFVRTLT